MAAMERSNDFSRSISIIPRVSRWVFNPSLTEPLLPVCIKVEIHTGPRPVIRAFNVAVFHRVVVEIIQCVIIMPLVADVAVAEFAPHLALPGEPIFQIPRPGCGPVKMFEYG